MSARLRLGWFAAIVFVAVFGVGNLAIWIAESIRGPNWWALDFTTYDAARRVVDGATLYTDPKYLYPPVGSLLGLPFLAVDRFTASLVLAAGKIAIAAACVFWLTSGWRASSRAFALVGLVTSLPFLHDLFLGNTNVFVVAAMVPALFGRSHARNGVFLGLAAAAFGKPLMIPVLLWLAIWRRETFVGAVVAGTIGTAVGVAIFGLRSYADWVTAVGLRSNFLSTPFAGNHGVTAVAPELWLPTAIATAAFLVIVLAKGGPRASLVWAVTSGILLTPYAGTYSALFIALALPAIGPLAPRLALAIVAASPMATTIPLPFYAAGILLSALGLREKREVGSSGTARGSLAAAMWEPPKAI